MRIRSKVALVGGIPIAIAAAIALVSWLLLLEADRARTGAVLASAIYRNFLIAVAARDGYVGDPAGARTANAGRFRDYTERVRADLPDLSQVARDPAQLQAVTGVDAALGRYVEQMDRFIGVTDRNDRLIAQMTARAATLVSLADQARERQRASNADIVASLTDGDRRLRFARDRDDRVQELRAAVAALGLAEAQGRGGEASADSGREADFLGARLRNASRDVAALLRQTSEPERATELLSLVESYEESLRKPADASAGAERDPRERLAEVAEHLLKVHGTEQRSLHEETAQLLTYSVEAHETEQATQAIAIIALKLGRRVAEALDSRNVQAASAVLEESRTLADRVGMLPISPLIQTEMIDAIAQWRESLATTIDGLKQQNAMITDMDASAAAMVEGARSLNDMFAVAADRIGTFVRQILVLGAAAGLLLGAGTAYVVARSITRPLHRLQEGMLDLAADPAAGPLIASERRDELGDMARAANFFVTEIGRREQALRQAKDRADAALFRLRQAQDQLIRAEKLASLGQLVAGVAHEINTPVGIALTTATTLGSEVDSFRAAAEGDRLHRSELRRFITRMSEGSRLLFANLTRAADLVQSFKQVAADQASGERRRFVVSSWLHELLTSLGPALRKTGHDVRVTCPPDLQIETEPGVLAQILTNLIINAVTHAYAPGVPGHLAVEVSETGPGWIRIVFTDDGRGIAAENIGRVFDPFFTTRRDRGSTGLGLHIVHNLVVGSLQGRIDLESAPGRGTRFTLDLPAGLAEPAAVARLASA